MTNLIYIAPSNTAWVDQNASQDETNTVRTDYSKSVQVKNTTTIKGKEI